MKNLHLSVLLPGAALFALLTTSAQALNGGTSRITTSNGWKAIEVISQGDNPAGGVNHAMPGTFDGTGALLIDESTLRIQVNHEETDASVSEVDVNRVNLRLAISNMIGSGSTGGVSFVTAAQQAYDRWSSNGGSNWTDTTSISNTSFYRFCSSQSFEPDTFGVDRGFVDHLYITGEEGSTNRLFVLESATRDFYQLSGVVGNASVNLGGIGGMPFDSWENAALLDTGETQHVALVLSPDGGTQRMQLYIGIKGKDASGNNSSSFLARNGLAYGSYFYFNATLPASAGATNNGTFDATTAGSLVSTKLEDVDTNPNDPTQFALGDQDSGVFVFDTSLNFGSGSFNAAASSFTVTMVDANSGGLNNMDNLDWTGATNLGGTNYPNGLIFVNEDNTTGEIYQMNPDGSNQIKVGQTSVSAESTGIFDLSSFVGYKPGSVLLTTNQGSPASMTVLIHPSAELLPDADGDGVPNALDTDDDNDIMPDAWEISFGLNPLVNDAISDPDGDELTNLQEYQLGNVPVNRFDPPLALPGLDYMLGVDDRDFGEVWDDPATATMSIWEADGSYYGTEVSPMLVDAAWVASADICRVATEGLECWWWAMDGDVVYQSSLQSLNIAGTSEQPVHNSFLKYEDQPNVWVSAITDGFRISGDTSTHACVVSSTLGIYCWASYSSSDLVSSTIPASLKNVTTVKDVAVGTSHACAINGSFVTCWGDSANGKTVVPGAVSVPKRIAAGSNHTCAINNDGTVSCWGDNTYGQKGDLDANGYVDGVSNALRITTGDDHTCAVMGTYVTGGTSVVCWGRNHVGQTVVPVSLTNFSTTPVDVRATDNKTCAVKASYKTSEEALVCWPVGLLMP